MSTICMNPGPIAFDEKVLKEMKRKGISHVDPSVINIFGECLEMMRRVFLSSKNAQPLILAGSGTLGWEVTAANMISKGDEVLVVNTGYFGDHIADCFAVYGAKITHLRASKVGGRPSVSDLEGKLKSTQFKMISLTHVDTSTGVLTDVKAMAKAIRSIQPNALIVVDGVCALGGEECRMEAWDLDVVLTGSQKCLGVPAGLALMVISVRGLRAVEAKRNRSSYYADLNNWIPIMKNYENRKPSYFATPAVNHIYALHVALSTLLENGGMSARFKEHKTMSDAIKKAIAALGCEQVPLSLDGAANTMTCVRYPKGVEGSKFLPVVTKNGISLSGGLHKDIKTEYFRIGHMGPSTRRIDHALKTIQAIEIALDACGHKFEKGAGVHEIKEMGKREKLTCGSIGAFQLTSADGCPAPFACQGMTVFLIAGTFFLGYMMGSRR